MPLSSITSQLVARIAAAVSGAADFNTAAGVLCAEVDHACGSSSAVFELTAADWTRRAGTLRGADGEWQAALATLRFPDAAVVRLNSHLGPATAIDLSGPDGRPVVFVIDADLTSQEESLRTLALVLSFALHSCRQRGEKRAAERRLRAGYAMTRRLSALGGIQRVAQRVVDHVAQLLSADRVSLALFDKGEHTLSIVATHGYSRQQVEEVRIVPGTWVIGHVYSTRRPVFVRDARRVPTNRDAGKYRTFAFGAVPLLAGDTAIGVLTVTDKRDGSAFDRQDARALRGISVAAATALMAAHNESEATRLAYAATTDSVTGLVNRPYLDARLHEEVERTKRDGTSLAVLMADIDDFKRINDSRGHQLGDAVLRAVGATVRSAVRVFDVCARYGGDEFAILMPNCDRPSAIACAERIRVRIADGTREHGPELPPMSLSIGVAVIEPGESSADLLARADRCLYEAKAAGKNAVRAHPEVATPIAATQPLVEPASAETRTSRPELEPERSQALPYVLVVDADQARAAACMEGVKPFNLGLLIVPTITQATSVVQRIGAPLLVIVDLSLPDGDAFAVIDAMRDAIDRHHTEVIALSSSRDLREYAVSRLGAVTGRVLSSTAPLASLRAAIDRALRNRLAAGAASRDLASPEHVHALMSRVADEALRAMALPGAAVYLRAPQDSQYRALFKWVANESLPESPHHVPEAFATAQRTGEVVVIRDLASAAIDGIVRHDAVRGLVAAPIIFEAQAVGAICVFDVQPLKVTDAQVAALAALGREALSPQAAGTAADKGSLDTRQFRDRVNDRAVADATRLPPSVDFPPVLLERSGGEFAVARELARARREGRQLSVVMFDVASSLSREAAVSADDRLPLVADSLLKAIRQSDLPIRWSVSELLVVLPGLGAVEARKVAERVRAALFAGSQHSVAISGGVAEIEGNERFSSVIDRARERVSLAVVRGHNRIL